MPLTSRIDKNSKELLINISGNFDFSVHPDFRKAYVDADPGMNVVVDLRQTEYMDSAALGMLLLLAEHFPSKKIALTGCNEYIKQVLEIARFEKKFDIS